MNSQDQEFMQMAVELAIQSVKERKGGPFGAVVVKDGKVVGKGANIVTSSCDPTAHAEVVAIRDACQHLHTFDLEGCTLYTSCQPCPMCLTAIYWARIGRLVYGCSSEDAAQYGFDDAFFYEQVSIPLHQQVIESSQTGREQALKAFKTWEADEEKTAY